MIGEWQKAQPTDLLVTVVTIVVIDGFTKKTTPGSLIEPAVTYLFPANWLTLPLSFGLLMSPWGGHSVFPNVSVVCSFVSLCLLVFFFD